MMGIVIPKTYHLQANRLCLSSLQHDGTDDHGNKHGNKHTQTQRQNETGKNRFSLTSAAASWTPAACRDPRGLVWTSHNKNESCRFTIERFGQRKCTPNIRPSCWERGIPSARCCFVRRPTILFFHKKKHTQKANLDASSSNLSLVRKTLSTAWYVL